MDDDQDNQRHPGGRPTKYHPEMCERVRLMAHFGAIDVEMAAQLKIALSTFYLWQRVHPEFSEASALGKEAADARVEQALFRKATGYSYDAVKIMQHEGCVIEAPYVEHVPPSDNAIRYWLNNRRPDAWKDKATVDHTGGLTVNIGGVEADL